MDGRTQENIEYSMIFILSNTQLITLVQRRVQRFKK